MGRDNLYYALHSARCEAQSNLDRHLSWRKARGLPPNPKGDVRWRTLAERVRLADELMKNLEIEMPRIMHVI